MANKLVFFPGKAGCKGHRGFAYHAHLTVPEDMYGAAMAQTESRNYPGHQVRHRLTISGSLRLGYSGKSAGQPFQALFVWDPHQS